MDMRLMGWSRGRDVDIRNVGRVSKACGKGSFLDSMYLTRKRLICVAAFRWLSDGVR